MQPPALRGPDYFTAGLKLVLQPGLRMFVLLPLSINLLLFIGLISFAVQQFDLLLNAFMPSLPDWLSFLEFILWPMFTRTVQWLSIGKGRRGCARH